MPASSRVAVEGQRVDSEGLGAARAARRTGWTVSFWALYALGPAMSLVVIAIGYGIVRLPPIGTLDVGATYRLFYSAAGVLLGALLTVAMICSSRGLARSKERRESSKERSSRIGMRGMFGSMVGLMVLTSLSNLGVVRLGELMRTVVYSLPLLSCFGFTYLTDRYTFFDLFIKRGLSLLLTILVLTTYFSLILPGLSGFDFARAEPWAYALALLPVAFALPWLYRRVGTWVNRVWLGRRFTTVEAVTHFLSIMQRATSERQLIDRAEHGISTIFRAPTRIDLTSSGRPSDRFESTIDVPIHGGHGRVGVMRLGHRPNGAPFFSEDRSLLGSLAEVFAYMLENAVKHGVAAVRGPGRVEVDAHLDGDRLRIQVADNGPGFPNDRPAAQASGSGYGLKNIRERLRGSFADQAELVLGHDEARRMTVVAIIMPLSPDARVPGAANREPAEPAVVGR